MSAEDWEVFKEIKQERQEKRNKRLNETDTTGWTPLSSTHFRLELDEQRYVDWWPSANKWLVRDKVTKKEKYHRGGLPRDIRDEINLVLSNKGMNL